MVLPNVSLTKVTHLACAGAPNPWVVVWKTGVPPLNCSDWRADAARWLLHPSDLADLLKAQIDADGGELIVQWQDGAHRFAGLPVFTSRHLTEGRHLLLDPSAVATVFFGPAQVLLDEYSNGKAISGAAEAVVFNFADLAVLRPGHVVMGSS